MKNDQGANSEGANSVGLWVELKKQRYSVPLVSMAICLLLLSNLLSDPHIDFAAEQSPGIWPATMLSGLLLVSLAMLLRGIHGHRREWKNRNYADANDLHGALPVHKHEGLITAKDADISTHSGEHDNRFLVAGIAGIAGYGAATAYIGFPLATAAIIVYWLIIWRERNPVMIIASSLFGTAVMVFFFVKVGYLPLPKGEGPFHNFTVWLFKTFGVF